MTQTITEQQALDLSERFNALADTLAEYKSANIDSLTGEQKDALAKCVSRLRIRAMRLITQAVGIKLDSSSVSLSNIRDAVKTAQKAIATINTVKKVIEVAGAVISLGAAIASKDMGAIATAVKGIWDTAKA